MVFRYAGADENLKDMVYTIEGSDPVYTSFYVNEDYSHLHKKFTDEVFGLFVQECQLILFPPKVAKGNLFVHVQETTIWQCRALAIDHLSGNNVVIYSQVLMDEQGKVVNREKKNYTMPYIEFCLRFIDFDKEMLK